MRSQHRRSILSRMSLALPAGSLILINGLSGGTAARASTNPPAWQHAMPAADPPSLEPYTAASAVDDPAVGQLVLYDPIVFTNCSGANPLWVWDGETWSNPPGGADAPVRESPTIVYDGATRRVLMFGGDRPSCGGQPRTALADTWEWNGSRWVQQHPATSPAPGAGACAAYDLDTKQVVMFGGSGISGVSDPNTWTWNGTNWTAHQPAPSPPTAGSCGMAYDSVRHQLLLTTEDSASSTVETWAWDGAAWSQLPSSGPTEYNLIPAITFDGDLGEVVLYNGRTPCTGTFFTGGCGTPVSQTWAWNGANWQDVSATLSPASRFNGALAFDNATHQLVLFGGWPEFGATVADTWILAAKGTSSVVPQRLAGADRVATAVAVSQDEFTAPQSASAVVLARGDGFADALTGGPLAVAKKGPLLLTSSGSLDSSTSAEISRVLAPRGIVYLLGGTSALSTTVQAQVTALGFTVVRIAGPDRYGTAVDVAGVLGNPTTVLEASGIDFPDALAAGPAASLEHAAILLTIGSSQANPTAAYLAAHPGARFAIGDPAATADPAAVAIVGADRYATSAAVARAFFPNATSFAVATGAGFADALSGGALSGARSQPTLLLPATGAIPESVHAFVATHAGGVVAVQAFGGTSAVGASSIAALGAAMAGS
ncbi:MAG TPA: cell wall-binding repeat-containing protein [Acidothermaceae bacterium]